MKIILSILLSVIMLSYNLGIGFAVHYCGGVVAKKTFVYTNYLPDCNMSETYEYPHCSKKLQKNCCSNHLIYFNLNENVPVNKILSLNLKNFITLFLTLQEFSSLFIVKFEGDPVPLLKIIKSPFSFFQSFLL